MLKNGLLALLFVWLPVATHANAASFITPQSIKVFTTLDTADEIVDLPKRELDNADIDVYFVDRRQDIMGSINSHIPIDDFIEMTEDERYEWGLEYTKKVAPKKTLKIMKSTLGVSYMRMFNIDRVPAVLIDDYYLTYGLPLSESLKMYQKTKSLE